MMLFGIDLFWNVYIYLVFFRYNLFDQRHFFFQRHYAHYYYYQIVYLQAFFSLIQDVDLDPFITSNK